VPPPLRKALGQHHLLHAELSRPLVDFLRPAGERVLEIGPGGGQLTGELLAAGAAAVVAWEMDPAWALALRARRREPELTVVAGDALELAWERLPAPTLVAGNLPYNVATALLERVVRQNERVPRAGFLVQLEVAERLIASPGDAAYGALSVLTQAWADVRLLGRVRRGSFRPAPKVDGAFVGLTLRPPPLPAAEMDAFTATVRAAFAQRRKTLRNSLGPAWGRERAAAALETLGWPSSRRAEELGLDELLALHRLAPIPPKR
jgi:16S rRNA (adenine1518-N6/adenine1519-N6)-dimethyltransferase